MKSLRQLLDSIDDVSEQRTALDSDLAKYRAGLISFNDLKKPVVRIGQKFYPCPIACSLEDRFYLKAQDIIKTACDLML